ncbi:hypothetical protein BofuT4_uP084280.1 [Botrytis cinerea T4]|uniref:Uncharacterized protein n=1 Tax=Botryotinia fuckeliana (strain T4) TaxID=999810 RepID=G2YJI7_BOTF4|nr:hypothetical protein BofuT4_uP084280.1 [Botrytis cinerea T4]
MYARKGKTLALTWPLTSSNSQVPYTRVFLTFFNHLGCPLFTGGSIEELPRTFQNVLLYVQGHLSRSSVKYDLARCALFQWSGS